MRNDVVDRKGEVEEAEGRKLHQIVYEKRRANKAIGSSRDQRRLTRIWDSCNQCWNLLEGCYLSRCGKKRRWLRKFGVAVRRTSTQWSGCDSNCYHMAQYFLSWSCCSKQQAWSSAWCQGKWRWRKLRGLGVDTQDMRKPVQHVGIDLPMMYPLLSK